MKRYISDKDETYYTYMLKLIKVINRNDYNWLITDIEAYPQEDSDINEMITSNEYLLLTTDEVINVLNKDDFQWIWAVFSAIPKKYSEKEILEFSLPFADNNEIIYQDIPVIQHPLAGIEIDAVDGTYVQIISADNKIINLFKKIYPNSRESY